MALESLRGFLRSNRREVPFGSFAVDAVTEFVDESGHLCRVSFFRRFLGKFAPVVGLLRRGWSGRFAVLGHAAPPF